MGTDYIVARSAERLTQEQEIALGNLAINGCVESRNRLVMSNIMLVTKLANTYSRSSGLDTDELVGAGIEGLVKAASKFNTTRSSKFGCLAAFYIRSSMRVAISKIGFPVHCPTYRMDEVAVRNRARGTTGGLPTGVSFDAPVGDDENNTLHNIASEESGCGGTLDSVPIAEAIKKLTAKERKIIDAVFGFGNEGPRSLESVGKEMKLTKEGVRLIKNKCVKKLKKILFPNGESQ